MTEDDQLASATKQIEIELARLRQELQQAESPDPIDVATVESLASKEVQELLLPILANGAHLTGVVLEPAGTIPGVVQLTFECEWTPGTSHITNAPAVSALVEISPPRLLKATKIASPEASGGVRFSPPVEPVPPALRNVRIPSATEAFDFQNEALSSATDWLEQTGLAQRVSQGTVRALGLTTGTKCTSLLCFERTSDDFDRPAPPKTNAPFIQ